MDQRRGVVSVDIRNDFFFRNVLVHLAGRGDALVNDAKGIPLARVCPACKDRILAKYRKDVLENPDYQTDEPIEPEE
jgi:hypothetical protein